MQAGLAIGAEVRRFDEISIRIVFQLLDGIAVLVEDRRSRPADPCRSNAISLGIIFVLIAGDPPLGRTGLAADVQVTYGFHFARRGIGEFLDVDPIGVGGRVPALVQIVRRTTRPRSSYFNSHLAISRVPAPIERREPAV